MCTFVFDSIVHARIVHNNSEILKYAEDFKKALKVNQFVILKNVPVSQNLMSMLSKMFGEYCGFIESAEVMTSPSYTASLFQPIKLHNDNAIDDNQYSMTLIGVREEDPLKQTLNGIVRISDVVEYLSVFNTQLLDSLMQHKLPMLSSGINYNDTDKSTIERFIPIISKDETGEYCCRFDLSRVNYYYWIKNKLQSQEEKRLICDFLDIANKFKKEFYLSYNDIMLINNRTTIHDRSECNFMVNSEKITSRKIFVSFVQ